MDEKLDKKEIYKPYIDKIKISLNQKLSNIIKWTTNLSSRLENNQNLMWWITFIIITILSLGTRLHYLTEPYKVVWDEAHFGRMLGCYINRTYFFDIHPPGGKLLLSLFGYLGGYNGSHSFLKPSDSYEGYDGIMAIRFGCAMMGVAMVMIGFLIVWNLTESLLSCITATSFMICDIGTMTLTKFILLDGPLMFFIMLSFYGFCLIHKTNHKPFSEHWWASYIFTGVMLGCVISVKFVGVFIVLVIGTYVILDLWNIYGDITTGLSEVLCHFLARAFTLIIVPAMVYVAIFAIHDYLLAYIKPNYNVMDESNFSIGFKMGLKNSTLFNLQQPKEIAFGSVVTIKSSVPATGYLTTFNITYKKDKVGGDKKTVVTSTFGTYDDFNSWLLLYPDYDPDLPNNTYSGEPEMIKHGDWVRIYHPRTNKSLACDPLKALKSTKHFLVHAKERNLTDISEFKEEIFEVNVTNHELWRIHVEDGVPDQNISVLTDRVQFICGGITCALTYTLERLIEEDKYSVPEMTCSKNFNDIKTKFHFESHSHKQLKNVSFSHMKSGFWSRFYETHVITTTVNSRLKPSPKERRGEMRPWIWPLGIMAHPWYDVHFRILLFVNPWVIWVNLVALFWAPVILVLYEIKKIRSKHTCSSLQNEEDSNEKRIMFAIRWMLYSYALHYFPFFPMARIVYYHHYFPALQFSSMLTGIIIGYIRDIIKKNSDKKLQHFTTFLAIFIIGFAFYLFSVYCYVGYGHTTEGPFHLHNSTYKDVRLFDDWMI